MTRLNKLYQNILLLAIVSMLALPVAAVNTMGTNTSSNVQTTTKTTSQLGIIQTYYGYGSISGTEPDVIQSSNHWIIKPKEVRLPGPPPTTKYYTYFGTSTDTNVTISASTNVTMIQYTDEWKKVNSFTLTMSKMSIELSSNYKYGIIEDNTYEVYIHYVSYMTEQYAPVYGTLTLPSSVEPDEPVVQGKVEVNTNMSLQSVMWTTNDTGWTDITDTIEDVGKCTINIDTTDISIIPGQTLRVTVKIVDEFGFRRYSKDGSFSGEVKINDVPVNATISISPESPMTNESVIVSTTIDTSMPISSIAITAGNRTKHIGNVTGIHTANFGRFPKGDYTAKVIITDIYSDEHTFTKKFSVELVPPTIAISTSPSKPYKGKKVTIDVWVYTHNPVKNVTVLLDGDQIYSTNEQGHFSISTPKGLSKGGHKIAVVVDTITGDHYEKQKMINTIEPPITHIIPWGFVITATIITGIAVVVISGIVFYKGQPAGVSAKQTIMAGMSHPDLAIFIALTTFFLNLIFYAWWHIGNTIVTAFVVGTGMVSISTIIIFVAYTEEVVYEDPNGDVPSLTDYRLGFLTSREVHTYTGSEAKYVGNASVKIGLFWKTEYVYPSSVENPLERPLKREFSHWFIICAHKKKVLERGLFGRERVVLLEPHLPERVHTVSMAKCDVGQAPREALAQGRLPEIKYVEETDLVELYSRLKDMKFNALSYRPVRVNINERVVEETGKPGVLLLERDSYKPTRQDFWRTKTFVNDLMGSHAIERRQWQELINHLRQELGDVMMLMVESEKMTVQDMQDLYLKQKEAISAKKTLPKLLTAIEKTKAAGGKVEQVISQQVQNVLQKEAMANLELKKKLYGTEEWEESEKRIQKQKETLEELIKGEKEGEE